VPAPRFFVEEPLTANTRIALAAAVAHHACRVLRLRSGDAIVLFDGRGGEYRARINAERAGGDAAAVAEVLEFDPVEREACAHLTLVQALAAASDKVDWLVEKAVEIGVARVIMTATSRSTPDLDEARRARRLRRWRELAIAACCQCGRNRVPSIEIAASLADALALAGEADFRWLLEPGATQDFAPAPRVPHSAAFAIGPEGGFEASEVQQAQQAGYVGISLGSRILRTETAGLAAAAAWLALNGEFGGAMPE